MLKARRGPCAGTAVVDRRRLAVLGLASFARRLELDMRASRTHRTPERRRRSSPVAYGPHLEMPPRTFHDGAMSRRRRVFVGARLRSTDWPCMPACAHTARRRARWAAMSAGCSRLSVPSTPLPPLYMLLKKKPKWQE